MTDPVIRPLRIAVIGAGDGATDEMTAAAEVIGRTLAEHGAVVITGGRNGVMAAASRGAASAGGLTIGILPDDTIEHANPWVAIPLPTGIGYARNSLVVRSVDGVVAVGGAFGTLSEIAYACRYGVPLVGVHTWELTHPEGVTDTTIERIDDPQAAAHRILERAGANRD